MTRRQENRLNGWKAIGLFVGRDQRTVRRWEVERGLPVHRVPGGGSATVWAEPDELRSWMAGAGADAVEAQPAAEPASHPTRRRWIPIAALAAAAMVMGFFVAQPGVHPPVVKTPYGGDATANAQYREANYGLSRRSVEGLRAAADSFGALSRRYPDNAAAFVGLAEANLLLREFNSLPNEVAYRRATTAAERALAINPRSASAMRALGFATYHGHGKRREGLDLLRRAVAVDPSNAQSHHWYGTALLGEGRTQAALDALIKAQTANEGSSAIAADLAYTRYLSGERAKAVDDLIRITRIEPTFSGSYRYLARMYLLEGRDKDYLTVAAKEAALRHDKGLVAMVAGADNAYQKGGRAAMVAFLIAAEEREFEQTGESAIKLALLNAATGNEEATLRWIKRAESVHEPESTGLAAYIEFVPYRDRPAFAPYFKTPKI